MSAEMRAISIEDRGAAAFRPKEDEILAEIAKRLHVSRLEFVAKLDDEPTAGKAGEGGERIVLILGHWGTSSKKGAPQGNSKARANCRTRSISRKNVRFERGAAGCGAVCALTLRRLDADSAAERARAKRAGPREQPRTSSRVDEAAVSRRPSRNARVWDERPRARTLLWKPLAGEELDVGGDVARFGHAALSDGRIARIE